MKKLYKIYLKNKNPNWIRKLFMKGNRKSKNFKYLLELYLIQRLRHIMESQRLKLMEEELQEKI